MSSVILKLSISLDGFIAPAADNPTWFTAGASPDGLAWTLDTVANAGAHLIGGATYTAWSGFYPTATIPFAAAMNDIPKVVVSNSLTEASWGPATIVGGDIREAIAEAKRRHPDGYLLVSGGVRLPRALVEADLVDEYRLAVHPVVLGDGERLFREPMDLEPISTTAFSRGTVAHVFRRAGTGDRERD